MIIVELPCLQRGPSVPSFIPSPAAYVGDTNIGVARYRGVHLYPARSQKAYVYLDRTISQTLIDIASTAIHEDQREEVGELTQKADEKRRHLDPFDPGLGGIRQACASLRPG